jgi:hypothetical protein
MNAAAWVANSSVPVLFYQELDGVSTTTQFFDQQGTAPPVSFFTPPWYCY